MGEKTLADRIAQAIGDPGSIVGRRLGPSWPESSPSYSPDQETVTRWSARAVLAVLDTELADVRKATRRTVVNEIDEGLYCELGDDGWTALESQAVDAGYPPAMVRRRRRPGDENFTTMTIEAAYQHARREAIRIARGGAS